MYLGAPTFFSSKGPLTLRKRLSELQQLGVLLGVRPLQVLHVLDHYLHGFTDTILLLRKNTKLCWILNPQVHHPDRHKVIHRQCSSDADLVNGAQHLRAA